MPRSPRLLALLLAFSSLCLAAPPPSDELPSISVQIDEKTSLRLEDDGTETGQRLYSLGNALDALDQDIRQWQALADQARSAENGQTSSGLKSHTPHAGKQEAEILHSVLAVMQENRADAATELQEAWKLANGRSWGSPTEHLASAQDNINSVRDVLQKAMPNSLYCRTQIKSANEPSTLHYMPEGTFRSGGEDWVSYTAGSKIKIGNYRFRVSVEGEVFNQKVTILQDPFVHVIQPL